MKQETFITKLTMFLLFAGLAAYFGIYTIHSLNDPFSSMLCYTHRVDNVVETTGYVVREETVLPRQNGVVDILPEEGEKVAVGETVAMVYRDSAALEQKLEIRRLELELEQLEYSLRQDSGRGDVARLDRDIVEAMVRLRGDTATGDFSRLEENAMQLKSMVFHRNYTYNNNAESVESITAMIREVSSRLKAVQNANTRESTGVYAPEAGVYSSLVDGYETILTVADLKEITPSGLEEIRPVSVEESGQAGKVITASRWYFAAVLERESILGLKEGDALALRFSREHAGEIPVRIERISGEESGRVVLVVSSDRKLADVTLLRRQNAELILDSYIGIRVPKAALRVEENAEGGQETVVYAVVGKQAERKPVTILAEEEEYFLVEPMEVDNPQNTTERKKSLRPGDEIVVNAKNLYDGKVVK